MKGGSGDYYRLREIHLSLTLIILCFIMILIWDWKKEPFLATLISSSSSEFVVERQFEVKDQDSIKTAQVDNVGTPEAMNSATSSKPQECNYGKGRWVADSRRPLYSGQCKYIQRNWACRLSQRPDFSFEGYRWQPQNCEIPEFDRAAFLKRMQDKTIAFIGDSLSREQFQSMMCMSTGGEDSPDVIDIANQYGFLHGKPGGNIHHDGWAYRFLKTNTTILHYWSDRLCDLNHNLTNPPSSIAMHLDRPPAFIRKFLHQFDVLVLNTGHHWNSRMLRVEKRVMYVNGKPSQDKFLAQMHNAKNLTVINNVLWLDSQLAWHPKLKVFFRTISPRHFRNGDWNSGGSCNNLIPMTGGSEVLENGSSDQTVEGAVKGTKVKMLDITALSQLRDEAHVSHYSGRSNDCLHWCLPGVPDTWNEILVAQI